MQTNMSQSQKMSTENRIKKLHNVIKRNICLFLGTRDKQNESFQYEKPVKNALFNITQDASSDELKQLHKHLDNYCSRSRVPIYFKSPDMSTTQDFTMLDTTDPTMPLHSTKIVSQSPNISQYPFLLNETAANYEEFNPDKLNEIIEKIFHIRPKKLNFSDLDSIEV